MNSKLFITQGQRLPYLSAAKEEGQWPWRGARLSAQTAYTIAMGPHEEEKRDWIYVPRPNIMAPTERNIKTSVMPHVISALDFPNCFAWIVMLEKRN